MIRRVVRAPLAVLAAVVVGAGCGAGPIGQKPVWRAATSGPSPSATGTATSSAPVEVRLAFAGDVHFTGRTLRLLDDPDTALAHTGWSGRLVIETCHFCACYTTLYCQATPAVRSAAASRTVPVLGITGTGGSGKSSLTDELVRRLRRDSEDKARVAVLAVDPTRRGAERCWAYGLIRRG